jgi:trans-2,3-dihydro-3-hydroxyanthranilate isomerase
LNRCLEQARRPDQARSRRTVADMRSDTHRYFVADVFTRRPLEGNQVAVFTQAESVPPDRMQALARELHLSETVFVLPTDGDQDADAQIRIFTPAMELPFAGHPIIGTAFVLGTLCPERDVVRLATGAGVITVTLVREGGEIVSGTFGQPVPTWRMLEDPERLFAALGVAGSGLPVDVYDSGPGHVYVELENETAVSAVDPDMSALRKMGSVGANCFAGSGRKWKNRMFAPGAGVPEDPATGSAAGPLALHLARHGRIGFGEEIEISQGREIGRPSLLFATAFGSADRPQGLAVGGSAVVVAEGNYLIG